jgi:methyl-accepting chemotaxis protein
MRLRSQLLLSAVGTSVLCGVIGTLLLGHTVSQSVEPLLDSSLRSGEQAIVQKWNLRRALRHATYDAIAQKTYFRAYLLSGDRSQMEYFAKLAKAQGADAVAVVDRAGALLAREGATAEAMATRAQQQALGPDGELTPLASELYEIYRIPVGGEGFGGYLITGHRIDESALKSDVEGLGISIGLAMPGLFLTTLPRDLAPSVRIIDDSASEGSKKLHARYHARVSMFGRARLLVAVPLLQVQSFSADFVRQLAGVLLVIMVATAAVALIVLDRITGPIEKLKEAADLLGRGQLLRTRSLLQDFTTRDDEIGALARAFNIAAQRLNTFVAASQRLVRHLNIAVNAVERSAAAVAGGAAQQEERLEEVTTTLGPMTAALEQTSLGLADARNAAISLSLVTSAADQAHALMTAAVRRAEALLNSNENPEPRGFRTASLLQQISLVSKLNADQREAFQKVRDQVTSLKRLLDDAVESQIREQHQGQFVHRATSEIGKVAKQHNGEALALRTSAEQLRRDMEHLHKLLSAIDAQGQLEFDETAAASSGYYRPVRTETGTSSDRLTPVARRARAAERAASQSRSDLPSIPPSSSISSRIDRKPPDSPKK